MSALVVYANTREAKESPDLADEETGPRLAKLGGACCKEVGSAPQILATLPLSYRNTDGAPFSITPRAKLAKESPAPGRMGEAGGGASGVGTLVHAGADQGLHAGTIQSRPARLADLLRARGPRT